MCPGPRLPAQEEAQRKEGDDSESSAILGATPKACYHEPRTRPKTVPPASALGLRHSEQHVCSRNI